jgi:hypothetical protein
MLTQSSPYGPRLIATMYKRSNARSNRPCKECTPGSYNADNERLIAPQSPVVFFAPGAITLALGLGRMQWIHKAHFPFTAQDKAPCIDAARRSEVLYYEIELYTNTCNLFRRQRVNQPHIFMQSLQACGGYSIRCIRNSSPYGPVDFYPSKGPRNLT